MEARRTFVGRDLILPQSNVLDFVDSPCEALPSLRNEWEWNEGECGWREQDEGKES